MILPWLIQRESSSSKCDSWKFYCSFFLIPEAQDQANNSAELLLHVEKNIPRPFPVWAFWFLTVSLWETAPSIKAFCGGVCAFHWDVSKKIPTIPTKATLWSWQPNPISSLQPQGCQFRERRKSWISCLSQTFNPLWHLPLVWMTKESYVLKHRDCLWI